jgi:hypothetical protein
MVRCKEFDTEEALQMALEVLQTKGFDGASIRDLVEAMGISRQSLYDSYGEQATLYHGHRPIPVAGARTDRLLHREFSAIEAGPGEILPKRTARLPGDRTIRHKPGGTGCHHPGEPVHPWMIF